MSYVWSFALFAGLAERLGARALKLEWAESRLSAGEAKARLTDLYPEHADVLSVSFVARNRSYADDGATLSHEDELALLPPVSGGDDVGAGAKSGTGDRYRITGLPIEANSVLAQVYHPDHGASLAFVGMTREWTRGKRTLTLEYEAYAPMAEAALADIGDEIAERWPGTLTAIWHRIGAVGINEISVVIAVSSPHRAEGYEASRYAIERLKQKVPIWKKEIYEDGTEWKGHQLGPWDPLAELEEPR